MEFQESLELQDLLAGLEQQKPKIGGFVNRFERVLKFRSEADAKAAQETLAALLPEGKRDGIAIITAEAIDNGVTNYRLTIPSSLLTAIKKANKRQFQTSQAPEGGYIEQLEARSPFTKFAGPRPGPDDIANPKASVNTFMAPFDILVPAFDLCDRLEHAKKRAGGNKHKYYAASGSYGIRFDSSDAANEAKTQFSKLMSGKAKGMSTEREVISPKEIYYWLKVPSASASEILSEANALTMMMSDIKDVFNAGDISKAEQERTELLEFIEGMGFGSSHVAEQMARRVQVPRAPVRQ